MGLEGMPTAFIIDSSLLHENGHNYDLTRKYLRVFRANGFQIQIIANKKCAFNMVDNAPVLRILVDSFFLYQRSRDDFTRDIQADASQLGDVFYRNNDIDSIVLFHTAYAATYLSILRLFEAWQGELVGLPKIHLVTPFCIDTMPKNGLFGSDALESVRSLQNCKAKNRVVFWAENEALAQHYNLALKDSIFSGLGMPLQQMGNTQNASHKIASHGQDLNDDVLSALASRASRDNQYVVSFLGGARDEKGFPLIPEIITQCLCREELRERLIFFIHYTEPKNGFSSEAASTVSCLREGADTYPSNVILSSRYLDSAQYQEVLTLSDAILCMYDRGRYKFRGSSIVFDAVAAGCGIVGPKETVCDWNSLFFKSLLYDEYDEIVQRLIAVLANASRSREVLRIQAMLFRRRMSDEVIYARISCS